MAHMDVTGKKAIFLEPGTRFEQPEKTSRLVQSGLLETRPVFSDCLTFQKGLPSLEPIRRGCQGMLGHTCRVPGLHEAASLWHPSTSTARILSSPVQARARVGGAWSALQSNFLC